MYRDLFYGFAGARGAFLVHPTYVRSVPLDDSLPRGSSNSSGSSRRRGSSSRKKTTGSSRTKGGIKKCGSSVNSSSSHHTWSGTNTSDRETSSAKLSSSKKAPLGQPRPRKLWEELQNSSRHIYAEAQDRYKSERDKFLFERSRFRRLDLGNFKVNCSDKAHEASDVYLLQGLVFLHELNMFSSILRARQDGTLYELHGLK